jgi:hypothetical protein
VRRPGNGALILASEKQADPPDPVLTFASREDADRVVREVGGPWMREHIVPLLGLDTDRSVGEVIASAQA